MEVRPPTTEEMKSVTTGYKVFLVNLYDNTLESPFQGTIMHKYRWNISNANKEFTLEEERGFHVFLYQKDAIAYARLISAEHFDNSETLVVHQVKIKDILCFGRICNGYYGSMITGKDTVIQCRKIKLMKRVYESC